MVTLPVNLGFSEELSVAELYTGLDVPFPDFEPIEIFNFGEEPEAGRFEGLGADIPGIPFVDFGVAFDYITTGYEIGLELDVDTPTFGDVSLNYPISTTLELPSFVDAPGATFEVGTGSNFSSTSPSLTGQAIDFGIFGLDFIFGIDPPQIANFSLTGLPGFTLFDGNIERNPSLETEAYRILGFGGILGGVNELNLPGFSIELGFPEGEEETDRGQVNSPSGVLEPLSVEADSTLFGVNLDLVDLISTLATRTPASRARNLPIIRNILEGVEREFSTPIGDLEFSFSPLTLELNSNTETRQSFEFNPGDITATFSIEGIEGDSGPLPLGESFTFTAPDNLEEPIVGQVVYDFSSQITVDSSLVFSNSGTATVLDTNLTLQNSLGSFTLVDFGIDGDFSPAEATVDLPLGRTFNVPLQFTQRFEIPTDSDSEGPSLIDVPPPITPPPVDTPNIITGTPDSDSITGTDEDDIITGGQGQDTLTGGGGSDQFVYTSIVDAGDTITDFEVGVDQIVLTEVLDSFDYQGSDPIADEYVQVSAVGFSGALPESFSGSFVQIDPDGAGSGSSRFFILVKNLTVTDLDNPSNFVF